MSSDLSTDSRIGGVEREQQQQQHLNSIRAHTHILCKKNQCKKAIILDLSEIGTATHS
jgi:hypothetical protein